MGIENQPLRQLDGDHVPVTLHEVDGDTATDTYHIPGRPLPEEPREAVEREPRDNSHNEEQPWHGGVDSRSPEHAYRTKGNIVRE